MAALISVLIAVTLSLLITRIAAEALTLIGLSRASASFQARSAFTGAGFTTTESESVVKHPVDEHDDWLANNELEKLLLKYFV